MNPSVSILLGLYNIVWGLWVANPFVSSFTNTPLYSVMTAISPELFWGLAVFCIGVVVVYGAVTIKTKPILAGTGLSAAYWLFVSISLLLGQPANQSFLDSLIISIYASFTYLNVKCNNKNSGPRAMVP